MKKVDLHIHTIKSVSDADFNFSLIRLQEYVNTMNIDCIAITNHNLFDVEQFKEITMRLNNIVIFPGIEINLCGGHLLLISDTSNLEEFSKRADYVKSKIILVTDSLSYEEFINKLNMVNEKIYHSLILGGRHVTLIGDIRKNGKYYSILKDMKWFGDLESHIIKIQHNCLSDNKIYSNHSFIPIKHEHILVFRKDKIWVFSIKVTESKKDNIMNLTNITWRDLIQATLEFLNNKATVDDIYEILRKSKKAKNNHHVREKIRQILNKSTNFYKEKEYWYLKLC